MDNQTNVDEESSKKNSNNTLWKISEAFVLTSIPIVSYFIAFQYESGFLDYFFAPKALIHIELTNVLILIAGFIAIVFFIKPFVDLFLMIKTNINSVLVRRIIILAPLILILLIILYFYDFRPEWFFWTLVFMVAAYIFLELVFPILTQSKVKGYWNKLSSQDAYDSKINLEGTQDIFRKKYGQRFEFIIVLVLVVFSLSGIVGRARACSGKYYYILNTNPERVVLRMYNDNMICAEYDKAKKIVSRSFSNIKLSDNSNYTVRYELVGPLKPLSEKDVDNVIK